MDLSDRGIDKPGEWVYTRVSNLIERLARQTTGGLQMQRLTSDEQLEQIWDLVIEEGIAPTRTVDQWGDVFTIFESWDHVEKVAEVIFSNFAVLSDESAPSWEHLPESRRPNPYHHIEWAIGEFGFDDQYQTCSDCYCAIDTSGGYANYFWFVEVGDLICGDCIRKNDGLQDDYLSYLAQYFEEERSGVNKHLADPDKHGFAPLNARSSGFVCAVDHPSDHPEYKQWLTYGDSDELVLFCKAAKLIDPNLQIVWAYDGGSNVLWARFNPNNNIEFPVGDGVWGWGFEYAEKCPVGAVDHVLGYVLGLVFNKYATLHNKKGTK